MKICHLSTSNGRGGAYAAAYRLHQGLLRAGIDSRMVVAEKTGDDQTVITHSSKAGKLWHRVAPTIDAFPLHVYRNRNNAMFSIEWAPDIVLSNIKRCEPDLIHLHWVCNGYLNVKSFPKFNKPLLWTIHDMWPFTGGCHYSQDCARYKDSCGKCPQLNSSIHNDISTCILKRKKNHWKNADLSIVAPSSWLAKCARESFLFKEINIDVIPNGLDTNIFKPIDRKIARDILNLPSDRKLLLFGAVDATADKRKGLHYLQLALEKINHAGQGNRIELLIFGSSQRNTKLDANIKAHYLGILNDDIAMVLAYSAADIFIAPSVQDNLPNTVMESMACGTPCVAFHIGGMPDMIEHEQNGYLAQPFDSDDIAQGILWILENEGRRQALSCRSRDKVMREYAIEQIAERYRDQYHRILEYNRTHTTTRPHPIQ